MTKRTRKVTLRDEHDGPDRRVLWAYLDDEGNLHIDGQDLGPKTASVSSDGEYEWFKTISVTDVPRLLTLLGATPEEDVLDVLEGQWCGEKAAQLEQLLRGSDIKVDLFTWSG